MSKKYRVQQEWSHWVEVEVEADSFEEAIVKADELFSEGEGNDLEGGMWTGAYWAIDEETEQTMTSIKVEE